MKKKYTSRSKLTLAFSAFFIMLAVFFFAFTISTEKVKAVPNSSIYFEPAAPTMNVNQSLNLDAKVNPGNNQVTAVELHVTFDNSKLRLDSITPNSTAFPNVLQAAVLGNANGTASIIVGVAATSPLSPVISTATIATFSFHSLATGDNSAVAFTSGSQAAAVGEDGDVLTARTPASVTITGVTYDNTDFATLAANWLQSVAAGTSGDVSSDGKVNARDLGIMMSNWQN
ncbi:MAG: cohesin domain-containing protein [Parcubacteria group bacterium]